ncbi:MAG: ATP12 family protein [Aliishimia sp.]
MSEWKLKRFWTKAGVAHIEGGWSVTLDGRPVRTPAKNLLTISRQALAEVVAAEWDAQDGDVDPGAMPFTRLANSAQDKVAVQHNAVTALLAEYGGSDLLCYRAQTPQELVERQALAWDPLLEWIAKTQNVILEVQSGIMPVQQPQTSLTKIHELTEAMSPTVLTGFHDLVSISGSWVIGYAAVSGAYAPEALWDVAHVDEIWQAEQWGDDDEATEMLAVKRQSFMDAFQFTQLGA